MTSFRRHDQKLTEMENEHRNMNEANANLIKTAYRQGFAAVSARPTYAPSNPYPDEDELLYEAWDEGADDAGINSMYYNGVLKP